MGTVIFKEKWTNRARINQLDLELSMLKSEIFELREKLDRAANIYMDPIRPPRSLSQWKMEKFSVISVVFLIIKHLGLELKVSKPQKAAVPYLMEAS